MRPLPPIGAPALCSICSLAGCGLLGLGFVRRTLIMAILEETSYSNAKLIRFVRLVEAAV
jgi:hypothetical protein